MAVNHTYDETAGHRVVVAPMVETRPFWRSALLGAYMELVPMMMRSAVAACEGGAENDDVEGIVVFGDIVQIEPWATAELIQGLIEYGYMDALGDGRYRLNRFEKLVHWKRPEQVAREKAKRRDVDDLALQEEVRFRDGDQCRICHVLVKWGAPDSDPQGQTWDHKIPGQMANGDPEMLAVACRRCNGIRSNRADANEIAPWQPAPEQPYYTETTRRYLQRKGRKGIRKTGKAHLLPLIKITARPVSQADTAQRDPAPSGTPRAPEGRPAVAQGPSQARPASQADTAQQGPARPVSQADTAQRDPAPSGTPREPATRPKLASSSLQTRSANSPPPQPKAPAKTQDRTTPPTGYGREGKGRSWQSQPVRTRARRSRSKHPREDQS